MSQDKLLKSQPESCSITVERNTVSYYHGESPVKTLKLEADRENALYENCQIIINNLKIKIARRK